MFCAVYKSPKKADTYLYVEKKDDFSNVPDALMATFGKPQFVLMAKLDKRKTIAGVEINLFTDTFRRQGFYLQLPPKTESLLEQHRKRL